MAIGAATGGAVIALTLFAVHGLARDNATYINILSLGGVGGLAVAVIVGWTIGRGLGNPFRRAMVAMVALGGAAFVAAMTIVADTLVGRPGLLALALVCIGVLVAAYRALTRPA